MNTSYEIKKNFKQAWKLIFNSERILLTPHQGDDGDDIGSALALKIVLEKLGKKPVVAIKGGVPSNLQYLPGSAEVKSSLANTDFDCLATFGCNAITRVGFENLNNFSRSIINFDHHPDNTLFGQINIVEINAAAVAELVYYFLIENGIEIDQAIATCLLTGIFTDTGGFKHANTTPEVLDVTAQLLRSGARIDRIAFLSRGRKKSSGIKALAKGIENTRFDSAREMVFSVLTEEDLKEAGATEDDLDGLVEMLNNIPQARFALLLRQDGDLVKGSLRSEPHKKVDVSEIAKQFGGGGHKLSSGFKIKGKLKRQGDVWVIE